MAPCARSGDAASRRPSSARFARKPTNSARFERRVSFSRLCRDDRKVRASIQISPDRCPIILPTSQSLSEDRTGLIPRIQE
jgi:hypothetical protein